MHRFKKCQKIEGDPKDGKKCGELCLGRSSYCEKHHNLHHRSPNKTENRDGNYKRYTA